MSKSAQPPPPTVGIEPAPPHHEQSPVVHALDATPYIRLQIARGHRPRIGAEPRVMFPGATVDTKTAALAARWRVGKHARISLGLLIDQVFAFALRHRFKPEFKK